MTQVALCRKLAAYLVLDHTLCGGVAGMADTARAAAQAGVGMVQLRLKDVPSRARIDAGRAIQDALKGTDALFVVNDDVSAAIALACDGVHMGQGDGDPAATRARIGPDMILGLSVETEAHALAVNPAVVDYVGAGPVFATATKPDAAAPLGWAGLAQVIAASPVPAVAIGGVKAPHATAAKDAGAVGIAVVSAICGQPDPAAASRALVEAVA